MSAESRANYRLLVMTENDEERKLRKIYPVSVSMTLCITVPVNALFSNLSL